MKNLIISLLLTIVIFSGCNENIKEQSSEDSMDNEQLLIQINDLNDELEKKTSELDILNKKLMEVNNELSIKDDEFIELEEMNKSLQFLSDEYIDIFGKRVSTKSIYNLSNSPKLIEFKEVQGSEVYLHIIPYEESKSLSTLREMDLVEVLAYVYDSNDEIWALVVESFARGIGAPAMGYVRVDNLRDINENPITIVEHNLEDICIGDSIEDIISLLGRDYELVYDDYYTAIVYDGLFIGLDVYGYYANSVYLNVTEQNKFRFDGNDYEVNELKLLVSNLEKSLVRYYGNEDLARNANIEIDFIEFSIIENYTVLIRFDENNNIEGISIGSSAWLY